MKAKVLKEQETIAPLSIRLSPMQRLKLKEFSKFLDHKTISETIKLFIDSIPSNFREELSE